MTTLPVIESLSKSSQITNLWSRTFTQPSTGEMQRLIEDKEITGIT